MKTVWDRLFVWLAANAPVVPISLYPGASDEQIRQTERTLGVTFPEDVRVAYRLHDGQRDDVSFIEGFTWVPLERVVELWRSFKRILDAGGFPSPHGFNWLGEVRDSPVHGARDRWWNVAWIPLTEDGNGNHHYLDLRPSHGGRIVRWQEGDWAVAAPSFHAWLARLADDLERGAYFVESYGPTPR
jgi:cell wall assembly regulator SMI1